MRNPRQMSLFDALELPAAPIPPPEPPTPAPAREKLSLDIGDQFLGWVTGYVACCRFHGHLVWV